MGYPSFGSKFQAAACHPCSQVDFRPGSIINNTRPMGYRPIQFAAFNQVFKGKNQ
jgi:exo-beta-1,3-glucanase (GH17 family)